MPQKVVSPASAIGGEVSRNGLVRHRVGPKRNVNVIERLREQIRCIEGRTPVLDPAKPATVQALGQVAAVANGSFGDTDHETQGAYGTALLCEQVPDQAGFPAARLADEDGGALPRISPTPPSSSSFSAGPHPSQDSYLSHPVWTLSDVPEMVQAPKILQVNGSRQSIARLALDGAGVHEIKPAGHFDSSSNGPKDWAASWSAARSFALAMIARRRHTARRPVLWCIPRSARTEHGTLYSHGLRRFGLTPADVLVVETGNPQDTLWVLEEGLKSESLALVAGIIDDVALTPARRLALAAQKHNTPCVLITHPRMPPVGATATRWRVAAWPGAPHPLCASHSLCASHAHFNGLGARRLALTLERYRAAPASVTGRESIMEWSDEAVCLRLVANVPDRSHAPRVPAMGAAGAAFRAG